MKVVSVRHRFGGVAIAAVVAAALVVAAPKQFRSAGLSPQIHVVQLQAVTTSAVLSATDGGSEIPSQAGPRASTTAAATGTPNLPAAAAAIGLGVVLAPLWYLAAPVTLPVAVLIFGALGGSCPGCYSGQSYAASNPLAYIVLPGILFWLAAPIQGVVGAVVSALSPPMAAATARRKASRAADVPRPGATASAPERVGKRSASKANARPSTAAGKRAARSAK